MSKFFRTLSESDSESEGSDDVAPARPLVAARQIPNFLPSDSEEDTKRVVKPARDRRYEELKDLIRQMKNSKKIKDMSKVSEMFDDLTRAFQKAKPLIDKEVGFTPRFYLRCLVELEDFINENWEDREGRKNLSKNNARGLTTLRQRFRKYIRDFETETAQYREEPDPEGYSSEEGAVSESESEEEEDEEGDDFLRKTAPSLGEVEKEKKKVKKAEGESSEEESSDEWVMSSSSDSELEDLTGKKMEEMRKFFLKSTTKDEYEKGKKKVDRKKRREEKEKVAEDREEEDEGDWKQVSAGVPLIVEKPKMFEKDAEITKEDVLKKLQEIMLVRGKKGTDTKSLLEMLGELRNIVETHDFGKPLDAKVLFAIVANFFDCTQKNADCMVHDAWRSALSHISMLTQLLREHPEIRCSEDVSEETENVTDGSRPFRIRACILTMLERLDDEFTKILQDADCHSTEYIEKLKGEQDLCRLMEEMQTHLENSNASVEEMCRFYIRRISHIYYKLDPESLEVEEKEDLLQEQIPETKDKTEDSVVVTEERHETSRDLMQRLCEYLYLKDTTKRLRSRAMLCHIYFYALHDHWHDARDLMLMSHLQTYIDHSDIPTQLLYNRAICQLGLCAFRHGLIREAHNALSELQNGGRAKELLAQGMFMRNQDRTAEQEKLERQRRVPYHMHINLELTECVYLICAMLLEIPQMASKEFEVRRRLISRSFHYQLKQSERQCLVGPPENTREHVVAASRALLNGDWKACRDFIINPKMNAKVWNLFQSGERVKAMVVRHIQEGSLKTYLFTYSSLYDSVSLNKLADMFELDKKSVHAIISKMIIEEELSASLDEPAQCIVMHRVEPSRLQTLALQLTEKLNTLADSVEQTISPGSRTVGFNWGSQRTQNLQQDERGGRRQQFQKAY